VSGKKSGADEKRTFIHRGLAERGFERRFQLADHVRVVGAQLDLGVLAIELVREIPEAMKPRRIAIANGAAPRAEAIEAQAA
jgi:molecular chaperone IbpA